jgi:multimeric flavodoxin WrbA
MKILAINGSYRKKGNTACIIEMISDQMQSQAAATGASLDLEIIHLGHLDIQLCRGCRVCFNQGETMCPLKDDLLTIREKMQAADGLIISTPVYVNDVSGIVKTWLDRLAFLSHRPEFAGKHAYLIATVGQGPSSHALKTMNMALSTWGVSIVGQASFKMGAPMKKEQARAQFQAKTQKIVAQFYRVLAKEKTISPSFISLMTFRIQQGAWWRKHQPGTVDYEYWQSQGWMNPLSDYYAPHKTGKAKVTLARLAGAILTPFVT